MLLLALYSVLSVKIPSSRLFTLQQRVENLDSQLKATRRLGVDDVSGASTSVRVGDRGKWLKPNSPFQVVLAVDEPFVIYDPQVACTTSDIDVLDLRTSSSASPTGCTAQLTGICVDLLKKLHEQSRADNNGIFTYQIREVLLGATAADVMEHIGTESETANDLFCGALPISVETLPLVDWTLPYWFTQTAFLRSKTAPLATPSLSAVADEHQKVCILDGGLSPSHAAPHALAAANGASNLTVATRAEMVAKLHARACALGVDTLAGASYTARTAAGCTLETLLPLSTTDAPQAAGGMGTALPAVHTIALGVRAGSGRDTHELSRLIAEVQEGGDFFAGLRANYTDTDSNTGSGGGGTSGMASCTPLAASDFSPAAYGTVEILTVTNPPFVFYSEAKNAKLVEALRKQPTEEAREAFLDSEEGLKLGNARFSGYIIDTIAEVAKGSKLRYRLHAVSAAYAKGADGLVWKGQNKGTYGGGQHFVYNESLRALFRQEEAARLSYPLGAAERECLPALDQVPPLVLADAEGTTPCKWCANYDRSAGVCLERVRLPDVYWAGYFITHGRLSVSDMSGPFLDTGLLIAAPKRASSFGLFNTEQFMTFRRPFADGLWLAIFGVAVFAGMVFWYLESPRHLQEVDKEGNTGMFADFAGGREDGRGWGRTLRGLRRNLTKTLWLAFGAISAAHNHAPKTTPGRVFSMLYTSFCVVVVATYTASLSASLNEQAFEKKLQNTDDLIDLGQKVCVEAGTAYANYLDTVTHSRGGKTLKQLGLLDRCEGKADTWSILPLGAPKCEYESIGEGKFDVVGPAPNGPLRDDGDLTCRRLLAHSARYNRMAPNLQEMSEKVVAGECSALVDVDVLTEYVTSTVQFCPTIHTSGPMFWSQNLGIGVNKGLSSLGAGLTEHLAKFRNNGFLEDVDHEYFLKATCADDGEARTLGAIDFLPLFSMIVTVGVTFVIFELGGKRVVTGWYSWAFRARIRRRFRPRDAYALEAHMRRLFEAYAVRAVSERGGVGVGGVGVGQIGGGGGVSCGERVWLRTWISCCGYGHRKCGTRWHGKCAWWCAPCRRVCCGARGTGTGAGAVRGQRAVEEVRLVRKEFIQFLLRETPWLSRVQIFGGVEAKTGKPYTSYVRVPGSKPRASRSGSSPAALETLGPHTNDINGAASPPSPSSSPRGGHGKKGYVHNTHGDPNGEEGEEEEEREHDAAGFPLRVQEGGALLLVDDHELSPRRSVSWAEFSAYYRANNFDVKRGFNSYDTMEVGQIDLLNFRAFLTASSDLSKWEVKQAITDMDKNSSGTIEYKEFLHWYLEEYPLLCLQGAIEKFADGRQDLFASTNKPGDNSPPKKKMSLVPTRARSASVEMRQKLQRHETQSIRSLFTEIGKLSKVGPTPQKMAAVVASGQNAMTAADFKSALDGKHGKLRIESYELSNALKLIGTRGDGTITEDEFVTWYKSTQGGSRGNDRLRGAAKAVATAGGAVARLRRTSARKSALGVGGGGRKKSRKSSSFLGAFLGRRESNKGGGSGRTSLSSNRKQQRESTMPATVIESAVESNDGDDGGSTTGNPLYAGGGWNENGGNQLIHKGGSFRANI